MNNYYWTISMIVFLSIWIGEAETSKNCKVVELKEADYDDIHHMMKAFNTFLVNNAEANKKLLEAVTRGNQIVQSNANILRYINATCAISNAAIRNLRDELTETSKGDQETLQMMTTALAETSEASRLNFVTLFDAIADLTGDARQPKKVSRKKNTQGSKDKDVTSEMLREIMRNINEMKADMALHRKSLLEVQLTVNPRPFDCSDISSSNEALKSGVFKIYPFGHEEEPATAYCDMETNGGGWTVLLTRQPQLRQENFTRPWKDYKEGFGNPAGEYWLGNEALHQMTGKRNYSLRIEGKADGLQDTWGEFSKFTIESEKMNYRIHFSEGTDGPLDFVSWAYHNDLEFSTYDRDNDHGKFNCAKDWKSGWWFRDECYEFLLTGVFQAKDGTGLAFGSWTKKDKHYSFPNFAQMKIRPRK